MDTSSLQGICTKRSNNTVPTFFFFSPEVEKQEVGQGSGQGTAAELVCRPGFSLISTGCYAFLPRATTQREAQRACAEAGGQLAELDSREEWEAVAAAWRAAPTTTVIYYM